MAAKAQAHLEDAGAGECRQKRKAEEEVCAGSQWLSMVTSCPAVDTPPTVASLREHWCIEKQLFTLQQRTRGTRLQSNFDRIWVSVQTIRIPHHALRSFWAFQAFSNTTCMARCIERLVEQSARCPDLSLSHFLCTNLISTVPGHFQPVSLQLELIWGPRPFVNVSSSLPWSAQEQVPERRVTEWRVQQPERPQ